jgi:hypothetical protein
MKFYKPKSKQEESPFFFNKVLLGDDAPVVIGELSEEGMKSNDIMWDYFMELRLKEQGTLPKQV